VGWAAPAVLAKTKPVLTVGVSNFPPSASPSQTDGGDNPAYAAFVFHSSPTYGLSFNGDRFQPDLATSWRTRGNQTVTFTLRRDARFADGTLVTAHVVKNWFTYFQHNPKLVNGAAAQLNLTGATVTAIGKWTVRFHLAAPNPNLLLEFSNLYWGFVYAQKCISHPALVTNTNCGAGPYEVDFSQTIPGSKLVYVPNPYYYAPSQQVWSKIIELYLPQPSSMLEALRSGEIQIAAGDPSTAAAARKSGFAVDTISTYNNGLFLNQSANPALKSLQVRQAMNYAVDRKTLATAFGSKPVDEVLTRDGYDPNPKYANYYPYDPAKAKALLAAAGYPNGFSMDVLAYGPDGAFGTPVIEALANQEAAVGIHFNVTPAATGAAWGAALQNGFPAGTQGPFGAGPTYNYVNIFMKGTLGWEDPLIDRLQAETTTATPRTQIRLYRGIIDRTVTQAYFLPLMEAYSYWYYNPRKIAGFRVGLQADFFSPAGIRPR
jgi:peptide/nickel transport system substrate-binding protein